MIVLNKSTCAIVWGTSWTGHFYFHETSFLLERTNDRQIIVIQTWGSGIHFLKNEVSLSLQGKQLTAFVVNDKIWAFKQNLEFWKICICHYEVYSFPIFKHFSDETGSDTKECDFWCCIIKHLSTWITCVIQYTSNFQMADVWCHTIIHL